MNVNNTPEFTPDHEPSVETIELLCDRLADLGLAIGPATARDLLREILASEAPRIDTHTREALATALETIGIATQSAIGALAASAATAAEPSTPPAPAPTTDKTARAPRTPPTPAIPTTPKSSRPATEPPPTNVAPATFSPRRPVARRGPLKSDADELLPPPRPASTEPEGPGRPVFKRPRGR